MRLRTVLILVIPMLAVGFALLKRELDVIAVMDQFAKRGAVTLEPSGPAWVQHLAHRAIPDVGTQGRMALRLQGRPPWISMARPMPTSPTSTTSKEYDFSTAGRDFSIDGLRELRRLPELEELLLPDKGLSREESDRLGRLLPNCRLPQ